MNKYTQIIVALCAVVVAGSVAYNYLILVPQQIQLSKKAAKSSVEVSTTSTASDLAGPTHPVVNASMQSTSSLRNDCANNAYRLFSSGNYLASDVATDATYQSHYSLSKNDCYMSISFDGPTYYSIELYEATEGNMIGMLTVGFNSATGETGDVRVCQVKSVTNNCSTAEEFLKLQQAYMTD